MPLHILNPFYTLSSTNPPRRRPSRRSSAVRRRSYRRPSRVPLRASVVVSRRRLPSSSIARRRPRARRDVDANTIVRIASGSARARPRACHRARVTAPPRDCCLTISAVHRDRGFARARVATTTRSRSRRRRRERQKNVRIAIVERGAYLGRPRALNHSLVIHHVRHHGPVRRRRANARDAR